MFVITFFSKLNSLESCIDLAYGVLLGLELLKYFIKFGFINQFGLLLKNRRKKRSVRQDSERLKT